MVPLARLAIEAVRATLVAEAGDLDLMVGYRTTIARTIWQSGFPCPDVKGVFEAPAESEAVVLFASCGPVGPDRAWPDVIYRVIIFPDHDNIVERWRPSSGLVLPRHGT